MLSWICLLFVAEWEKKSLCYVIINEPTLQWQLGIGRCVQHHQPRIFKTSAVLVRGMRYRCERGLFPNTLLVRSNSWASWMLSAPARLLLHFIKRYSTFRRSALILLARNAPKPKWSIWKSSLYFYSITVVYLITFAKRYNKRYIIP